MSSVILRAAARPLAVLLLFFSLHMLLRGHNEPGGGFIGGLLGATGLVIHALACGTAATRAALRVAPESVAVAGLGVALLAGALAALWGDVFFTGQWLFLGATEASKGLPVSTVLLFDVGVYLVVFGAALALVLALEEEL
jgi:multicomponent Na+:H+ antiporter subunit B